MSSLSHKKSAYVVICSSAAIPLIMPPLPPKSSSACPGSKCTSNFDSNQFQSLHLNSSQKPPLMSPAPIMRHTQDPSVLIVFTCKQGRDETCRAYTVVHILITKFHTVSSDGIDNLNGMDNLNAAAVIVGTICGRTCLVIKQRK